MNLDDFKSFRSDPFVKLTPSKNLSPSSPSQSFCIFHHPSHFNHTSHVWSHQQGQQNPGSSRRCSSPWSDRNSSIAANLRGSSCGETQPPKMATKNSSAIQGYSILFIQISKHTVSLLVTFFLFLVLFPTVYARTNPRSWVDLSVFCIQTCFWSKLASIFSRWSMAWWDETWWCCCCWCWSQHDTIYHTNMIPPKYQVQIHTCLATNREGE